MCVHRQLCALFLSECITNTSYLCVCVCAERGRKGDSEREKVQSSACLSGHTIQHREEPFMQHSLPTPPSKLPSNSVWSEWTRWHGSTTSPPPPHTPLCSQPDTVCPFQLPPLSHSIFLSFPSMHPLPFPSEFPPFKSTSSFTMSPSPFQSPAAGNPALTL